MAIQGRKNKKNSVLMFLVNKTISVILIVVLVFVLIAYSREVIRAHNINKEIKAMEAEISKMEQSNSTILNNIQYYKTLAYLEKEARLKMNQGKEGEKLIIVSGQDEIVIKEDDYREAVKQNEISNFRKWFNYFFMGYTK